MWHEYPYTDAHELNLDWFLARFKELYSSWEELSADNAEFKASMTHDFDELDQTVQNFINFVNGYFDNLDVQEEINNKLQVMYDNGSLKALIEPYYDELASGLSSRMGLLEERMDSFTHLTEGSTTGDAELIDARIGYNALTYGNAGTAIRSQADIINAKSDAFIKYLDDHNSLTTTDISIIWTDDYYIAGNGEVTSTLASNYAVSQHISVNAGEIYIISASAYDGHSFFTLLDGADNVVNRLKKPAGGTNINRHVVVIPEGVSYLVIERYMSTYNAFVKKVTGVESIPDKVHFNCLDDSLKNSFDLIYEVYTPSFSEEDKMITAGTGKVSNYTNIDITDLISCADWISIDYTGKSFSSACCIAFYDATGACISTLPSTSGTVSYTNEIVNVPKKATYVRFADNRNVAPASLIIKKCTKIAPKENAKMWSGYKWTVVGDSLTEHNNRTDYNYHDYIAENTGISVYNMGVSGSGYMRYHDLNIAFYQRISNVPIDSDVVTIFGSGNDIALISDLGDVTDSGTSTICGCINTTIDNLYTIMPTVHLGIITPTPWIGFPPYTVGNSMDLYCEKIVEICKLRGIPCLDLYHCSNLRPWDATFRNLAYSKDEGNGVHPDETGHKLIAGMIQEFVASLFIPV